ncbi:MAG: BON domain-containing protein [Chromatiaceae bacterium]|nr:BON domain-containing protein [Chromatiaceae bacterium]MCF7995773.1 BON domain-containing protein [Chromatiaceae bacterium]
MFTQLPTPWSPRTPLSAKGLIWIPLAVALALALTLQPAAKVQAEAPTDAAIASGVRQALANHPALGDERITVVVHNGIVELSGYVDSRYERAVADTVADRVDGVRAVDNLLERREMPSPVVGEPASDLDADADTGPQSPVEPGLR